MKFLFFTTPFLVPFHFLLSFPSKGLKPYNSVSSQSYELIDDHSRRHILHHSDDFLIGSLNFSDVPPNLINKDLGYNLFALSSASHHPVEPIMKAADDLISHKKRFQLLFNLLSYAYFRRRYDDNGSQPPTSPPVFIL